MAKTTSSYHEDEAMEDAMGQDRDGKGVEALHHNLHQILLFLVLLGARLFQADNSWRLVPILVPPMFCGHGSSPFASLFYLGKKQSLAAPSAELLATGSVGTDAFIGIDIKLSSADESVCRRYGCSAPVARIDGDYGGWDATRVVGGAAAAVRSGDGGPLDVVLALPFTPDPDLRSLAYSHRL